MAGGQGKGKGAAAPVTRRRRKAAPKAGAGVDDLTTAAEQQQQQPIEANDQSEEPSPMSFDPAPQGLGVEEVGRPISPKPSRGSLNPSSPSSPTWASSPNGGRRANQSPLPSRFREGSPAPATQNSTGGSTASGRSSALVLGALVVLVLLYFGYTLVMSQSGRCLPRDKPDLAFQGLLSEEDMKQELAVSAIVAGLRRMDNRKARTLHFIGRNETQMRRFARLLTEAHLQNGPALFEVKPKAVSALGEDSNVVGSVSRQIFDRLSDCSRTVFLIDALSFNYDELHDLTGPLDDTTPSVQVETANGSEEQSTQEATFVIMSNLGIEQIEELIATAASSSTPVYRDGGLKEKIANVVREKIKELRWADRLSQRIRDIVVFV